MNHFQNIIISDHADLRTWYRGGNLIEIPLDKVKDLIHKTESILINDYNQQERQHRLNDKNEAFYILKTKNNLNIVGKIFKKANNYFFKVITTMIKQNFKSNKEYNDKIIQISENIHRLNSDVVIDILIENL